VRFIADECVVRQIVERLRDEGHDVVWMREASPGATDDEVLKHSGEESRVLLTEDWDFGELAVRLGKPALGIVIVSTASCRGDLDETAVKVARRIAQLGDGVKGMLTIIEAKRTRQRGLVPLGRRRRDVD
jgi:predicted nuclease of predicted toxin-antitoxin system